MGRRVRQDERGAIAIVVALLFPVFLLVGVLAVDVGNWYFHKRELQTQADAAALAAAAYFGFPCVDSAVTNVAQQYSGGTYNQFRSIPAARLTALFNATNFADQSKPNDTDLSGSQCADSAIDVKMTEQNVPWFFGNLLTPHVNAQARVSIREIDSLSGALPVAVPVPDPKRVRVTFFSEATGQTLADKDLCPRTDLAGTLEQWDNAPTAPQGWNGTNKRCDGGTPASAQHLSFNPADDPSHPGKWDRVGVIVHLSGSDTVIDCGQQLVTCYQSSTTGLGFIHGWSDTPAVTDAANSAPQPRSVVLLPGSCGDAYFSTSPTSCSLGLTGTVDFQPREFDATGAIRKVSGADAITLSATVTTSAGSSTPAALTYDKTTKRWTTSSLSLAAAAGAASVTLNWEQIDNKVKLNGTDQTCTAKNNNPCKGSFTTPLQRTVSANSTASGPIQAFKIGNLTNTSGVADERECSASFTGCGDDFVVTVGIGGTLRLSGRTDAPTALRISGGSQTQAIDCDPQLSTLKDEIAKGCAPSYGRNTGQACPDHGQSDVQGSGVVWHCVLTQTGQSPSQITDGMNTRILGTDKPSSCTARNHWTDGYQPGDPRIVPVFVVPYGAFQGSGNAGFPVQDFAYFYITGWTGNPSTKNPCQAAGDDPVPGNDAGVIVGHFIKYVDTLGGSGTQRCNFSQDSISGCAAVMTK